jgi:hypothetical protein
MLFLASRFGRQCGSFEQHVDDFPDRTVSAGQFRHHLAVFPD